MEKEKKRKAIDGTTPSVPSVYQVPYIPDEFDFDISILDSEKLEEIETGISKLNTGIDILALVQALAILKIEREALFIQAGFKTSAQYFREADARLNMPRQTISQRRQTGESYLRFRKKLSRFNLSGHVSKLRYLPRAVEMHGEPEALQHFKEDTARVFIAYASPEREYDDDLPQIDVEIDRGNVLIDGRPVVTVAASVDENEKSFVVDLLHDAYQARKGGLLPWIVPVYDKGEGRVIDNFLKKYRSSK